MQKLSGAETKGFRFRVTPIYEKNTYNVDGIICKKKTGCSLVEILDENGLPQKESFISGPSYEEFGYLYRNNLINDGYAVQAALMVPLEGRSMDLRTLMTVTHGIQSDRAGEIL